MRFADLPDRSSTSATHPCTVGLLVDGWPDDVTTCVESLIEHTTEDVYVLALDLGNVSGAGARLDELAARHPMRIEVLHVDETLEAVGWGPARLALLRADTAAFHVVQDLSTVLEGDALTPLIAAFADDSVVASGWRGVNVDTADWFSFVDAGPGEVDAVLSYLFAVRRDAAVATPPHASAQFYRNADLEWSLALRAAGGRIVAPVADLPARQDRHRGYHDSDPEYRDEQSKRTYMRMLKLFKNRDDILAPR